MRETVPSPRIHIMESGDPMCSWKNNQRLILVYKETCCLVCVWDWAQYIIRWSQRDREHCWNAWNCKRDTNRGENSNFLAKKSEKGHLAFTQVKTKYLDAKELGAEALKNLRRNKRKRGEETGNRGCKEWTRKWHKHRAGWAEICHQVKYKHTYV